MIIPITRSCLERMTRWYHVTRVKLDIGLHKFVRDGEEDAQRMQRRLHIHLCLLGCAGLVQFFGGPLLGVDAVSGISFATLTVQEMIDRIGKF